MLQLVDVPDICDCTIDCSNISHLTAIDCYYETVVTALYQASSKAIMRIPNKSLKPFWNEELDNLKSDSIFWHNMWIEAGKPNSGILQQIRLSCKAKYKPGIRDAYANYENRLTDELQVHFQNQKFPELWKTWNTKFRKNITKHININGHTDDNSIANEFAKHFSNV